MDAVHGNLLNLTLPLRLRQAALVKNEFLGQEEMGEDLLWLSGFMIQIPYGRYTRHEKRIRNLLFQELISCKVLVFSKATPHSCSYVQLRGAVQTAGAATDTADLIEINKVAICCCLETSRDGDIAAAVAATASKAARRIFSDQ
jgi:hypothetical protein